MMVKTISPLGAFMKFILLITLSVFSLTTSANCNDRRGVNEPLLATYEELYNNQEIITDIRLALNNSPTTSEELDLIEKLADAETYQDVLKTRRDVIKGDDESNRSVEALLMEAAAKQPNTVEGRMKRTMLLESCNDLRKSFEIKH
jgi:hypothetical protein